MALMVVQQYRYEVGKRTRAIGVVADWGCTLCKKTIYRETHFEDVPEDELRNGCPRCVRAMELAWTTATDWWSRFNKVGFISSPQSTGLYGLRDDLAVYLIHGRITDQLARYVRRNQLRLPEL